MRSPFATAWSLALRELDAVRADIGEQIERLSCLEARASTLCALVATERQVAATVPNLQPDRFFDRTAAEQLLLDQQSKAVCELLEQLRAEALERFAATKALELADERWRQDRARRLQGREQAASDDRAAFAFQQLMVDEPC